MIVPFGDIGDIVDRLNFVFIMYCLIPHFMNGFI